MMVTEADVASWSPVLTGFLGSLLAGLATGVGAIVVFFRREWGEQSQVVMLAVAGGIMLAATVFSLIIPAMDVVVDQSGSKGYAAVSVSAGVVLGALSIWLIHGAIPHEHFIKGPEGKPSKGHGRHWLFIMAITLHNVPEGMSVGVAFGQNDLGAGLAVAIGIGLQNMPEGLAVAAALISAGYSRGRAVLVSLLTGLVEPVGGLIGAAAVSFSDALLPWGLAFAAGAMLFVISGEVIPETHRKGVEHRATVCLVLGFVVMMMLDTTLG
jgi:zinc transporter, ZIP family